MRWQIVVLLVAVVGGCGRFSFDPVTDPDADAATDDSVRRSYSEAVLADQPRAYYRLGERTGTIVRDRIAGADADLFVSNGGIAELGRPGAISGDPDTAMRFAGDGNVGPRDGSAQLRDVGSTWGGDFTIELFMRPLTIPPVGTSHALFVCEEYLFNGFRTGWDRALTAEMWSTEAAATGNLDSSIVLTLGTWAHIAFIKRGATAEIFIDAQPAGSGAWNSITPSAAAECGFGAFHGMPSDTELDEVAIYDVALSQAQIAAHVAAR